MGLQSATTVIINLSSVFFLRLFIFFLCTNKKKDSDRGFSDPRSRGQPTGGGRSSRSWSRFFTSFDAGGATCDAAADVVDLQVLRHDRKLLLQNRHLRIPALSARTIL